MESKGTISIEINTEYCHNVGQTYITITEDKLENILLKNDKALKAKYSWTTPLGLFVTCLLTSLTAQFKNTIGISSEVWSAIFYIATVGSFIWTTMAAYKAYSRRKGGDIPTLISKIKNVSK